jgi:hypothetical protein
MRPKHFLDFWFEGLAREGIKAAGYGKNDESALCEMRHISRDSVNWITSCFALCAT